MTVMTAVTTVSAWRPAWSRSRLPLLAGAAVLALSLGACSVSISSPGGGESPSQSSQAAQADVAGKEDAASGETGSAGAADSAGGGRSQQGAQASTAATEQTTPGQASAEEASAGPGSSSSEEPAAGDADSSDRPGASAIITDSDWLSEEESVDKTMSCDNGPLLIDQSNEEARVEGDCTTLTVTGSNATVVADYAGTVFVNGSNIEVYVRDVKEVVISGANNTVVWAGRTPTVKDTGSNTEARPAGND